MNKLYIKRKDLNIESLYDMRDESSPYEDSKIAGSDKGPAKKEKETRSSKRKISVIPNHYPEICKSLLNMISPSFGALPLMDNGTLPFLISSSLHHFLISFSNPTSHC